MFLFFRRALPFVLLEPVGGTELVLLSIHCSGVSLKYQLLKSPWSRFRGSFEVLLGPLVVFADVAAVTVFSPTEDGRALCHSIFGLLQVVGVDWWWCD